ncbi:unnamed protein product [Boreogadus saida]
MSHKLFLACIVPQQTTTSLRQVFHRLIPHPILWGRRGGGRPGELCHPPTLQPQSVSPCKCTKSPLLFKPETRLANGAGNTAVALPELLVYRASFQSRTTSVGSREDINPRAFVTETPLEAEWRSWKSSPFLRAVVWLAACAESRQRQALGGRSREEGQGC